MSYSFTCPACDHILTVEADSDDEAVGKLMAAGPAHMREVHPDMPAMTEGEMEGMVRSGMKKG